MPDRRANRGFLAAEKAAEMKQGATVPGSPLYNYVGRVPAAHAPPVPELCHSQWNCSSSVEPVSAVTLEAPPWITVVTSSK